MRTKRCFLFIVLGVISSFPAVAQVGLPEEPVDPGLIARANPALAGIEQVYLDLRQAGTEPNTDGLVWRELRTKVRNRLTKAGIKMYSGDVRGWPTEPGIPILTISVEMLKLSEAPKYVFRTQAALSRPVRLTAIRMRTFRANVWKHNSPIQVVDVENMPKIVTGVVTEQAEAFLHACIAANPPRAKVGDPNEMRVQNRRPPREHRPVAVAQKYVGSKNSRVFHRSDCTWANKIAIKNFVAYPTRKDAIRAGKRACTRCRP